MRIVLQLVSEARVRVAGETVAAIGKGLLLLVGVAAGDAEDDARRLAEKAVVLRIFEDDAGKMNLSVRDVGGAVLAVSQFTLLADCRRGRRPSFSEAMAPEPAAVLFERFVALLRAEGLPVETGVFGAMMEVGLANDGPVTLVLDSRAI